MADMEFRQVQKAEVPITPPPEVELKIRQGKRFIFVDSGYDPEAVPDGFSLVEHSYRGSIFKALIPHSVLYHMGSSSDNSKHALKELSDFCREGADYEEEGKISSQGINWIRRGKDSYVSHLTTMLTSAKRNNGSEEIVFNDDMVKHLMFGDQYVEQRMKAIAAIALGIDAREIQKMKDLSQIAVHVSNIPRIEETVVPSFIKCPCGSHIEMRQQYVVKQVARTTYVETIDLNMSKIEKEMHDYISQKGTKLDDEDRNLIRQRINLEYIAYKN
ncbi:hypothetical protein HYT92_02815, partial [Candidatus Pacearchaeota archaeon]|nr:hypothetical protein [Candidatus Pacearchaeota archaeon]